MSAQPRGGFLGMLVVLAFVAALTGAVYLTAISSFPSPEETLKQLQAIAALRAEESPAVLAVRTGTLETLSEDEGPFLEVDLGEFSISSIQPLTQSTITISFHLYGSISQTDHASFMARYSGREHVFRDAIVVILRQAERNDLSEPALGLIKRRILAKSTALLGEPGLHEVVFSDFSVVER